MQNFRPNGMSLRKRLFMTVAYFDVFDFPLKKSGLQRLIIGNNNCNKTELYKLIEDMEALQTSGELVFLKGRSNNIDKWKNNEIYAKKLIRKAIKKRKIFKFIPFLKLVTVCNYLPYGIAEANSDIDLFIVSERNRIFTLRLFMTVMTQIFAMRRHSDKIEGRYCLSFYIDEQNMNLKDLLINPYDLYFAYWQIALLPLYGEGRVFKKFKSENLWIEEYFSNSAQRYEIPENIYNKKSLIVIFLERLLRGKFGDFFESKLESYFMSRHKKLKDGLPSNASVEVSKRRLKFHNNDKRLYFKREFEKRLDYLSTLD